MAYFDMPLSELRNYNPDIREEQDFDEFWARTLDETRRHPLDPVFTPVDLPFRGIECFDVSFSGYGGQRVKAWYLRPAGAEKVPAYLEFIGYGGGRSLPHDWTGRVAFGMAHLIMDTRGQGSGWSPGDTPDIDDGAGGGGNEAAGHQTGQYPGFMTRGIHSPERYYYRRLFADAVRAWETLSTRPEIDRSRIAAGGGSQGGGITLALAGLVPEVPLVFPDVPFLCHFSRAIRITDSHPYGEIREYLRQHRHQADQAESTLSYFDGANFATRARADAVFSTSLMDDICPPSTVFAAYNRYGGNKEIDVYDFNGHEGGGVHQRARQIEALASRWGLGT
jgi:cephalosporin-C deacetylase